MRLLDLVRLARPKDWVKNAFVVMPVPFAVASGASFEPVRFLLGLAGFSLATSAVYALNDVLDAERDRLHPEKKRRPVAAGRVSPRAALGLAAALFLAGSGLAAATGLAGAVAVVGVYAALNLGYCFGGKNVPLLDVFLLSSGFVLRVVLGTVLVAAAPSNWLLLCSSALALFLALAKRRADLLKGLGDEHRPSLSGYSVAYLDQAMGITAAMTLVAYALYTLEAEVLLEGREFATLPFVVLGLLEYLRLAHLRGEGGSPVDTILRSPLIALCGLGWVLAAVWSVPLPR